MWNFKNKKRHNGAQAECAMLRAFNPPIEISSPQMLTSPVVLSSPHSGRLYPDKFLNQSRLDLLTLRLVEDAYVDEFLDTLIEIGVPCVLANFPRCIVDVNRGPEELPPAIAKIMAPDVPISPRAKTGMGVTPTRIGNYDEIYHHDLTPVQVRQRLQSLYEPYHNTLCDLLAAAKSKFGRALLIDCHSMPGSSSGVKRPDIILGTRYGQSCHAATADLAEALFTAQGFSVVRDYPYAGGFITDHYGRPDNATEAIQVEINKDLYLNSRTMSKTDSFEQTRRRIQSALTQMITHLSSRPAIAAQ